MQSTIHSSVHPDFLFVANDILASVDGARVFLDMLSEDRPPHELKKLRQTFLPLLTERTEMVKRLLKAYLGENSPRRTETVFDLLKKFIALRSLEFPFLKQTKIECAPLKTLDMNDLDFSRLLTSIASYCQKILDEQKRSKSWIKIREGLNSTIILFGCSAETPSLHAKIDPTPSLTLCERLIKPYRGKLWVECKDQLFEASILIPDKAYQAVNANS